MTVSNEGIEKMEVDEVVAEPLPPFDTIRILQVVKDAQAQHGLRHGDYNRYRKYCRDKLERVRRHLKFVNVHKCVKKGTSAKFTKKWVDADAFNTDEKFVLLCIFEAERRWAQAMDCKTQLEDAPQSRKRQTMMMCLKAAVRHAVQLEELVRNSYRCDAPTKLEAQAYLSYLIGVLAFELKTWPEASESLKNAKNVYERLAEATPDTTISNQYKARCREIQPQLRLCEFSLSESNAEVANMGDLMNIRMQIGDSETINKLISEVRQKTSSDEIVEVSWGGETAIVSDEKAKAAVVGWRQADKELAAMQSPKEKMSLYEKQLADTREAMDRVGDAIRRKTAEGADTSALATVRAHLDFLRLSRMAERYLAIIDNTKLEKKYKPQDLLRLYDSVIEICKEVLELSGAALDKQLQQAFKARVEYYRAFRCYYIASAYASLRRPAEAYALFVRANERVAAARQLIQACKGNTYIQESTEALSELSQQIEQARVASQAALVAAAAGAITEEEGEKIETRPLADTAAEWRSWNLPDTTDKKDTKKVKNAEKAAVVPIARTTAAFAPMPTKPLFFDLALNHIKMPDLEERISLAVAAEKNPAAAFSGKKGKKEAAAPKKEEPAAGIASGITGWFWGKK